MVTIRKKKRKTVRSKNTRKRKRRYRRSKTKKEIIMTTPPTIVRLFENPFITTAEVGDALGFRRRNQRQKPQYWLKKLCREGYLNKVKRGIYDVTTSGKTIFGEYGYYLKKQLIRLEACRIKYRIKSDPTEMIKDLGWKKSTPNKNNGVDFYHGKSEGHTCRLIVSENNTFIEVATNHATAETPEEAYYAARLEVDKVVFNLQQKYNLDIIGGITTHKPEFAVPSKLSDLLLYMYGASQIRTPLGVFNRSKGRDADWETKNLQDAQKIMRIPQYLDEIDETVVDLSIQVERIRRKLHKDTVLRNYSGLFAGVFSF